LRHGKVIARCDPRKETAASLANMMVGTEVKRAERLDAISEEGEVLLEIRGLNRAPATPFSIPLRDISLSVRAGHIVGIAGVAGNGQSELFEALSGETKQADAATVRFRGRDAGRLSITGRRQLGVGFVPEERLGHGAVPAMALSENLLLSRYATDGRAFLGPIGLIRHQAVARATERICTLMDVRKNAADPEAAALSGGNLQKFIIGRELDRQPSVLIVNQPTWGVDAGASARIRQALIALARNGSAILVISQDLDELFEICDAIAVMHNGLLSRRIPIAEATFEKIGLLMGGAEPGHVAHDERGAA
jgi:simple sugar transport system ATP-binding protein